MIRQNAINILKENFKQSTFEKLSDFVEYCATNDPHFFRWLFDTDLENDFHLSLVDSQMLEFENFIEIIESYEC